MVKELELAVADAAAREAGRPLAGRADRRPLPDNCANCGTRLSGRWCHACGQNADDHRQSVAPLIKDGLESFFHLDGRLMRTLPQLFLRPGRLVDDFFKGRVTRHVPPFRLFLAALFVYFLAAEAALDGLQDDARRAALEGRATNAIIIVTPTAEEAARGVGETMTANPLRATPAERRMIAARVRGVETGESTSWVQERMARSIENPGLFTQQLLSWAQRMAILLLPLQAAILGLLYMRDRRWFFYDHLVCSMTHLSFVFLTFGIVFVLPQPVRGAGVILAMLATPMNLYLALRGGYGSGRFGAVVRAAAVSAATLVGFGLVLAGLVFLSLTEV